MDSVMLGRTIVPDAECSVWNEAEGSIQRASRLLELFLLELFVVRVIATMTPGVKFYVGMRTAFEWRVFW